MSYLNVANFFIQLLVPVLFVIPHELPFGLGDLFSLCRMVNRTSKRHCCMQCISADCKCKTNWELGERCAHCAAHCQLCLHAMSKGLYTKTMFKVFKQAKSLPPALGEKVHSAQAKLSRGIKLLKMGEELYSKGIAKAAEVLIQGPS